MKLIPLSPKEKAVLEFLENYIRVYGVSPSFQEIRENFGFSSFNSVQRYLKQLESKGYIKRPEKHQKRGLTLINKSNAYQYFLKEKENTEDHTLMLPLLGRVAAGLPLEAMFDNESVSVPKTLVKGKSGNCFALEVNGASMINLGIFERDILIVRREKAPENGQIVVAIVNNEATVKKYYLWRNRKIIQIELRPANPDYESMWYPAHSVDVQGVVCGLLRKY